MTPTVPSTCFIVNPHSAGGRTRETWPHIARQVTAALGDVSVRFTGGRGDATHQAKAAIQEGYELIIAIGGDGTNNEIINGFFDSDGQPYNPDATFAFYPSGSGGDLRRSIPTARTVPQLLKLIQQGEDRFFDLGKVTFLNHKNEEATRFFLNVASLGLSAMVNQRMDRSAKRWGGTATFFAASIRSILSYTNPRITLQWDEEPETTETRYLVAVGNGRYFGGGMKIAPDASMNDGLLDLVVMGDYGKTELVFKGTNIYFGAHLNDPRASVYRVQKVRASSEEDVFLDVDGESPGRLPATFEVLPQRIRIRCLPE